MRLFLKNIILFAALFCVFPILSVSKSKVTMVKCGRNYATSFAVITDNTTYQKCGSELAEYRKVLESEGLGTYIIASDWENPQTVRDVIIRLYNKKPRLEGVVFVGDVPIAMVRQAQYMTTAFKMNEKKFPEFESSVASDRFYDDFDLQFDFIKRDSLRSDIFYYRLSEKGSQTLRPEIYSARMRVPGVMEGDKYEIMGRYLRKVVAAHKEKNVLDDFIYFAGHGYNSDCLTIWRQKPLAFRESFPYCFDRASHNTFLNFRQKQKMKDNLANELQREDTDFFIFSEHGDYDTQYINGADAAGSFAENYEMLKRAVGKMYKRYKGTDDDEPFLKEVLDSVYHLPRSAVSDSALAHYARLDSLEYADENIFLDDIMAVKSNPRMVVFNACYNGSFHRNDGYVAGCHVFGDGKCVVAQGNTVNVLQDKWEDKLIGLLSVGERVGMWQKEVSYLESHLIGDPTFRFAPHSESESEYCKKLHNDLIFNAGDESVWTEYAGSDNPLSRAVGVTHLSYISDCSGVAYRLFDKDVSPMVRLHSLNALSGLVDENLEKAVIAGMTDPYEVIVRTSYKMAGESCNTSYLEPIRATRSLNKEKQRAVYVSETAESVLEPTKLAAYITVASDVDASVAKRTDAVRMFRNNRLEAAVDALLGIVTSADEDEGLRVSAAEALGWYNRAVCRDRIVRSLADFLAVSNSIPSDVEKEMVKTVKRLTGK